MPQLGLKPELLTKVPLSMTEVMAPQLGKLLVGQQDLERYGAALTRGHGGTTV